MKTKSIFSLLMLFCSVSIFAQHPLVGTWEFVSGEGTDIDGNTFDYTTANMRETKIITPTHYMLIQHIVRNDSVIFNIAHAGTVRFEGNKYMETPTVTSSTATGTTLTDFTWKVKGDQFIQSGTITMPDGRKIILDELVFKKVKGTTANPKNPIVGTWNQLSSEGTLFNGTQYAHTSPEVTRFDVITPTHWMRIAHRRTKFESAIFGPCTVQNNKVMLSATISTLNIPNNMIFESTYRVEGNKLYTNGTAINAEGKKLTWSDVFEKVGGK